MEGEQNNDKESCRAALVSQQDLSLVQEDGLDEVIAKLEQQWIDLKILQKEGAADFSAQIQAIEETATTIVEGSLKKRYGALTPWQIVQIARHKHRPQIRDYIKMICSDFVELHGDKSFRDDQAIVTGLARIRKRRSTSYKVMIIGHDKGGTETSRKLECFFGMPHPEGYRKALEKMCLAEKFHLPIISLIDTKGAFPGVGSEERGIASAIAVNLKRMPRLRTPMLAIVIGEGGSGGALGIASCPDKMYMLRYSYYSVISPEGCAGILYKPKQESEKSKYAELAANALKLTAKDLRRLKLIDGIIREPIGGAHRDPDHTIGCVESCIRKFLKAHYHCTAQGAKSRKAMNHALDALLEKRYEKLRHITDYAVTNQS